MSKFIGSQGPSNFQKKVVWKPFQKQSIFLSCPAFEVLYGGSAGGGKSDALLISAIQPLMFGVQNYKGLLLRRKYIDLERSLIVRSHELFKGRGSYDGQNKRWRFPNNCTVEFGHCQRKHDIFNYQSAQYQYIGVEQAEQFTEDMYLYFFSRLRSTDQNLKCRIRLNANPGGIGHAWLKKRFFIGEREPNKLWPITDTIKHPDGKEEEFTYKRTFVPATVYDNEHIMKNDRQYLMRLMALPEKQRDAYLWGRWDTFEGQFFTEWNPATHVCEPFEIPKVWKRAIAFDWGFNDPTCVLWFAEDPKTGIIYCYRELYINKTIDEDVARKFDELSRGETIDCIYYPHDLDNDNPQTGVSMHERMDEITNRHYFWKLGNKDRMNGWANVRNLLSLRGDKKPRMKIFNTCKNLIRTIPEQIFDDTRVEDLDTLGDDHCVDALRYFAATYRKPLEFFEEKKKDNMIRDLGGARMLPEIKLPNGHIIKKQFVFKKPNEAVMSFAWMNE